MKSGKISVDIDDVKLTLTIPKKGKPNGDKTATTEKSRQNQNN